VFGLPFRLALGAHANRAERLIQLRVARTVAIGAAEALWLALIAALFVVWAMSPSAKQSRELTGDSPGCLFMGKAGLMCDASASAAQRTEGGSCNVSGRGWRYCPPAK
jgi:Zn-dependent protease with chaperone function